MIITYNSKNIFRKKNGKGNVSFQIQIFPKKIVEYLERAFSRYALLNLRKKKDFCIKNK